MPYPSDMTDSQWEIMQNKLDNGRKRKHSLRHIVNAILYLAKTGAQWRYLPSDYPNWKLVYYYFSQWATNGILEELHDQIVEQLRKKKGKQASPSLLLLDSQTVKTGSMTQEKGFDGHKKIQGRKRFVLTDTVGLVWAVKIVPACVAERAGANQILELIKGKCPRLVKILADQGFDGAEYIKTIKDTLGYLLEIVCKVGGISGFQVLPKRWIVERTFGWWIFHRRLVRDYEMNTEHSTAFIYWTMLSLMTRKI